MLQNAIREIKKSDREIKLETQRELEKKFKKRLQGLKDLEQIIFLSFVIIVMFFVLIVFMIAYNIHNNGAIKGKYVNPIQKSNSNEKGESQKAITIPDKVHNADTNKQYEEKGVVKFFVDSKNNKSFVIVD